ncbi:histidine phosphatase superfamily branch 1 [Hokovirus HKV1]|uniref:Histidine phosphatase superfamily branch 1 n=1 Tax=Hokovirus HKV1 TaxID=1977638 RepID=A0A1V0SF86_9VIRU|nr:histidine phosphatase superfamily branch 1 [Hokovirus HKV1]
MTSIIIRHAHDDNPYYKHSHDKKITSLGKSLAYKLGDKLVNKYGYPDIIFCSPFTRTIQTTKKIKKSIDKKIKIIIDNRLSRYFTHKEKKHPDVYTKTIKKDIPIYETYDEFKKRCDSFINDINYYKKKKYNIWIITHVLVLKRITKKFRIKIHKHIDYLEYYKL